jgi:hypothetical protein
VSNPTFGTDGCEGLAKTAGAAGKLSDEYGDNGRAAIERQDVKIDLQTGNASKDRPGLGRGEK